MFYFVLTIHLLLCVMIIGLVLLQQGKGAQVGAILSGSSNTLFGAAGAGSTLSKLTTWFAIAFFATSVILVKIYGTGTTTSRVVATPAGALDGSVLGDIVHSQAQAVNETAQAPAAASSALPPAAPAAAPVAAPLAENAAKGEGKK